MGIFGKGGSEAESESGEQDDTSIRIDQKIQALKMIMEGYDPDSAHPDRVEDPNPEEIMNIISSELPKIVDELSGKDDDFAFEQIQKLFGEISTLRQMVTERLPISDQKRSIIAAFKKLEARLQA